MLLLRQMIILFLLMATGYILKKINIISPAGEKTMSGIVVNVANPALVLSAAINPESTISGRELADTTLLAVAVYAVFLVLAFLFPLAIRATASSRGAYSVMMVFSNIGFMGFPLLSAMYGAEALLYATPFMIIYNVLIYTYAVALMDRGHKWDLKHTLGKIFNVGVLACIITIILYLTRLRVPDFIETTVGHLSALTAPLSMMVIGASMTDMKLRELFTDFRLIIFCAVKLLIIPVAGVFCIKALGVSPMLTGVCLIMLGTPVGSMTAMMADQCGSPDYPLVAKGVALSTVLSVATLPLAFSVTGI